MDDSAVKWTRKGDQSQYEDESISEAWDRRNQVLRHRRSEKVFEILKSLDSIPTDNSSEKSYEMCELEEISDQKVTSKSSKDLSAPSKYTNEMKIENEMGKRMQRMEEKTLKPIPREIYVKILTKRDNNMMTNIQSTNAFKKGAVPSETCEKLKWSIKTDVESDENKCSNSRRLSEVKVINETYLYCHPPKDANKTQEQEHKTNDTQQNQDQSSSFQARDEPTKILIQHAKDLSQGLKVAEKNNDNKNKLTRRTTHSSRQHGIWKEDDVNEKLIGSIDLIDGAKILNSGKHRNLTQTNLLKEKVTSVKKSICATKNNVMRKDLKKMCTKFYPIFRAKNNVKS